MTNKTSSNLRKNLEEWREELKQHQEILKQLKEEALGKVPLVYPYFYSNQNLVPLLRGFNGLSYEQQKIIFKIYRNIFQEHNFERGR